MSLRAALPAAEAGGLAHARLLELISQKCFSRGDAFRLASGRSSNFYFDMKPIEFDPEAINLVADLLLEALATEPVDYVGGLEMGAVPLVTAVCLRSYLTTPIPGFFVRKEVKSHGTRNKVEGVQADALRGKRAVLLDDVTTTGGSVMKAVEAARDAGATVKAVITLVDRLEGAHDNLAAADVRLRAIYTAEDFGA